MKSKVLGAGPPDPLPDDDEAVEGGCSHNISAVLCPHLRWASRKAQITNFAINSIINFKTNFKTSD